MSLATQRCTTYAPCHISPAAPAGCLAGWMRSPTEGGMPTWRNGTSTPPDRARASRPRTFKLSPQQQRALVRSHGDTRREQALTHAVEPRWRRRRAIVRVVRVVPLYEFETPAEVVQAGALSELSPTQGKDGTVTQYAASLTGAGRCLRGVQRPPAELRGMRGEARGGGELPFSRYTVSAVDRRAAFRTHSTVGSVQQQA